MVMFFFVWLNFRQDAVKNNVYFSGVCFPKNMVGLSRMGWLGNGAVGFMKRTFFGFWRKGRSGFSFG